MKIRLAAVCAIVMLAVAVLVGVLMHSPAFSVTGDLATPLRPGATVPLDLTIANPHTYSITVTSVKITVDSVTEAGTSEPSSCDVSNFSVIQSSAITPRVVAAGKTVTLAGLDISAAEWPQVHMLKSKDAQDACKQVAVSLGYHATGNFWDNLMADLGIHK